MRDSLFNYIKCIQKYRYLSYFAIGKSLWQIDSDNGHLSSQKKVKSSELSTASALKSLYPVGSIFSPLFNLRKKNRRKNKEKEGKGRKERRRRKACPQTRGTWSEFLFQMTNTDFILCYKRLENIAGNIQLLCRQYLLMLSKRLSLYALY